MKFLKKKMLKPDERQQNIKDLNWASGMGCMYLIILRGVEATFDEVAVNDRIQVTPLI